MRKIAALIGAFVVAGCLRPVETAPKPPLNIVENQQKDAKPADAGKKADDGKKTEPAVPPDGPLDFAELKKQIEALRPVEPIGCEKLLPLLPKAPKDYQAREPLSESIDFEASVYDQPAYTFKYNFVEQRFRNGDDTLVVRIIDTAKIPTFFKWIPESKALKEETENGYEKGVNVAGLPGRERYSKTAQRCELTVMVGLRYQIEIIADGSGSPEFVRGIFNQIDRKALVALK